MLRILDCQKWKCFLIFQKERLKVPTHLFGIVNKIAFFSCISTESCGTFLFDFEEQVIYFQVKFRFRFLSTTKYSRNKLPAQKLTCRNWFYRSETKIKEISPCVIISKIIFGSFVDWEEDKTFGSTVQDFTFSMWLLTPSYDIIKKETIFTKWHWHDFQDQRHEGDGPNGGTNECLALHI